MLYNDVRPVNFEGVIGQEDTLQPLEAQCREKSFAHAYMMYGKHGCGKTSLSRIMARAINCMNVTEKGPCGECPACKAIATGTTLDYVELDAASHNGVDDIRNLIEQTRYVPTQLKYKVFVIDEVHMLSTGAFNALLKTLEEPPEYVVFFLCTTEMHKVPRTIVSRCQLHEFKAIDSTTIATYLAELCESKNKMYELDALYLLAKAANGALRDALGLLEQCLIEDSVTVDTVKAVSGLSDETASFKLISAIATKNISNAIDIIQEIVDTGKNLSFLIQSVVAILSDLLVVLREGNCDHVFNTTEYKESLMLLTKTATVKQVFKWIKKFAEIRRDMNRDISPELYLQAEIISLSIEMDEEDELVALKKELGELKNMIQGENISFNSALKISEDSEKHSDGFEEAGDENPNPFESAAKKPEFQAEDVQTHQTQLNKSSSVTPVENPTEKSVAISIPGFEIAGTIDDGGNQSDGMFKSELKSTETVPCDDIDDGGFDFPGEW